MNPIKKILADCDLCPRNCHVDRTVGQLGICNAALNPKVARISLHHWEEPPISGERGSGTIFFSGCNLKCCFCQNYPISHEGLGSELSIDELAEKFLYLQFSGAHNINLVTGSPYVPQIILAIRMARLMGLVIPIVYNTSSYEKVETLKLLEGLVDIYLPDLKWISPEMAKLYAGAPNYFAIAGPAILEMFRQVGPVKLDEHGLMRSGMIIRHLIMPGGVEDSFRCLEWIHELFSTGVFISLMAQYLPFFQAEKYSILQRQITPEEYQSVVDKMEELGFEEGFVQGLESATDEYIPKFDLTGVK